MAKKVAATPKSVMYDQMSDMMRTIKTQLETVQGAVEPMYQDAIGGQVNEKMIAKMAKIQAAMNAAVAEALK